MKLVSPGKLRMVAKVMDSIILAVICFGVGWSAIQLASFPAREKSLDDERAETELEFATMLQHRVYWRPDPGIKG